MSIVNNIQGSMTQTQQGQHVQQQQVDQPRLQQLAGEAKAEEESFKKTHSVSESENVDLAELGEDQKKQEKKKNKNRKKTLEQEEEIKPPLGSSGVLFDSKA